MLASGLLLISDPINAQSLEDPAAAASPGQAAAPAPLAGWSTFEIKKTKAELTETARLADDPEMRLEQVPTM